MSYDDLDTLNDPPPPRLRRRCPECGAWGWHWPGCPEDDNGAAEMDAEQLAEETSTDEGD